MVKIDSQQTNIGTIPLDWTCNFLGKIADIKTGPFGSALHAKDYVISGVPIITVEHLGEFGIKHTDLPLVSKEDYKRLRSYKLHTGDIVFSRVGSVDRNALIAPSEDGWLFSGRLLRLRTNKSVFSRFLSYYFHFQPTIERIKSIAVGQTMPSLNTRLLKGVEVALPPPNEQKAIAEALSDIDRLIVSTEKLIAKKKAIKQGLMQELLTGKCRLPGFTKKWVSVTLEELGRFKKGSGISRESANSGRLRAVRYGELYTLHEQYVTSYGTHISENIASGALLVKRGDILFAASGETKEEIGKCAAIVDEGEIYAGGDIIVFSPRIKTDPIFWGSLLNSPYVNKQKSEKGQGDAVVHIHATDLAKIRIVTPPLPEQEEIAKVFFAADKEILKLKTKLQKLKLIKSGMMSELLTGRIRLLDHQVADNHAFKPISESSGHNEQFDDAVMISVIVNAFYSPKYPLGRKKIQKLLYLARRYQNASTDGFMKKAAGPYKPSARYNGGEGIAIRNHYIEASQSDKGSIFAPGATIQTALNYSDQWNLGSVIEWLLQNFKFTKVDDLEVLATVDMAICDLKMIGKDINVTTVKSFISHDAQWRDKLNKKSFSDRNIDTAIKKSLALFSRDSL